LIPSATSNRQKTSTPVATVQGVTIGPSAGAGRIPFPGFDVAAMLAAVSLITLLRLAWLWLQPAGLYPDEAQYWFWSNRLAFGYYSKPPLVAWLVALTTALFGDREFAIRLSAPLLTAGAAVLVYAIGAHLYGRRIGVWAAIAYASLPGAWVAAWVISTDAPLLLFWAAALYAFIRAREAGGWPWWLAAGLAAGFGLLSKYAMAYWLLSAFGLVVLVPSERRHLKPLLAATGVALLVYSPNLWWNWDNRFVSYRHTADNAGLTGTLFHPGAFLDFFGVQFAVFGPLFFAGLLLLAARPRALAEPRARLLAVFALPTLAMMFSVSFLSRAHANWAAPAYVSATVLVVAWLWQNGWRRLVALSVAVHLAAALLLLAGPPGLAAAGVGLPAPYDPLSRLRGWRELGAQVGAALAAHPGYRLFADDRETLAALIYYVRPHPFDAVKWDLMDRVRDEWDLTSNMKNHLGGNFLLVAKNDLAAEMRPSFAALDPIGSLIVRLGAGAERRYRLYLARDFKGYPQYHRGSRPAGAADSR
jgi:4-amino-4-deoxy-L-arabinose transferase-like glycosyltransferase